MTPASIPITPSTEHMEGGNHENARGKPPDTSIILLLHSLEELFTIPLDIIGCINIHYMHVVNTIDPLFTDVLYKKILLIP